MGLFNVEVVNSLYRVTPIIDSRVRSYCILPYPGHRKGCPNFNYRTDCPMKAPMFDRVVDMEAPVYAVVHRFDLASHVEKMLKEHPTWSQRQLRNLLYWQPKARNDLKMKVDYFLENYNERRRPNDVGKKYIAYYVPEAMGMNVTKTMETAGVMLE